MQHHNRGKTFPAEVLSTDDIARLLNGCSKRALTGWRNRALIAVLWRGGLRISEALSLQPKDVDLDRGTLSVLRGKGGKQRMVAIDPETVQAIRDWLAKRASIVLPGGKHINGTSTLFCTLRGLRVAAADMRAFFPALARRTGVEKRVHAHAFRHSHAYELLSEGARIDIISRQLGHSAIGTTARYLAHVSNPEVSAVIAARKWPVGVVA